MPGLAFKILAVSDIADNGIAVRFGERGSIKDYVYVHDSGVKCKLGKFKGVYVLKTVDVSQVAAANKVETKRVIVPKKHVDTDLWYYFGRKSPPNTGGIVVRDDGISQYCGKSPMPLLVSHMQMADESHVCFEPNYRSVCGNHIGGDQHGLTVFDLMSFDTGDRDLFSPYSSGYDLDFRSACTHSALPRDVYYDGRFWSTTDHNASFLPSTIFSSSAVPASEVITQLNRPVEVDMSLVCGVCPALGEGVTGNNVNIYGSNPHWEWCQSRYCENPTCNRHICAVNRSSVSKTSPYSLAKKNGKLQHFRSGCTSYRTLYRGCKNGWIAGMDLDKDYSCHCPICSLCKAKRASFKHKKVPKSEAQIEFDMAKNPLVFDYCGKMRVRSHGGASGFFCATTKQQRYTQVFPVKEKSVAPDCIAKAVLHMRTKFQRHVHHVHTDNAGEHKSATWKELEREFQFDTSYSPVYTPQKNSLAEFMNNMLCTKALCMMVLGSAPARMWAAALLYAAQVWNATPDSSGENPSPLQMLTGYPPDHSMFRVFWCPCYPLYFKEEGRGKFEVKTRGTKEEPCRFAGLSPDQPDAWRIYDPQRNVFFDNAHVAFDESEFDGSKMIDGQQLEDREWDIMMEKLASEVGLIVENVDDVDMPVAPPSGGVSNQPSPNQPDGQRGFSGGAGYSSTQIKEANQPDIFESEPPSYEADNPKFYDRVYDVIEADEKLIQQQQEVHGQLLKQHSEVFDPNGNDPHHWRNLSPRVTRSMVRGVEQIEGPIGEWRNEVDVESGVERRVYRSTVDGSELHNEEEALPHRGVDKNQQPHRGVVKEAKSTESTINSRAREQRSVPLYQAPIGTRVRIDNTRFDGDKPGSYSNQNPGYSYGEIASRSEGGVQNVRYDGYDTTIPSHWRHLEYENQSRHQDEGKVDTDDANAHQDEIQVEERAKSQATNVPNAVVFDPDVMASMMAAVAKIQDTTSRAAGSEFVQELICLAAAERVREKYPDLPDPTSFKEAMSRPDSALWAEAIKAELQGIEDMEVWEVIYDESKLPAGTNITKSKGVYKIKRLADGSIDKYKYRLVACGYSQVYGLDYTETYSGVVDNCVIRIFLAIVASLGLDTRMIDISQAFLYGELGPEENIYMRLPKELGGILVKLRKCLYGLKQSGRVFNRGMAKFLVSLGFKQSIIEPCLFYLFTNDVSDVEDPKWDGLGVIYIICHVDDMPVASNSTELLNWIGTMVNLKYKATIQQILDYFISLSIQVSKYRVSFHQEHFVKQLLASFNGELMEFCSKGGAICTSDLPMKPGVSLTKADCPSTPEAAAKLKHLRYPQLVGSLLYLVEASRHDLKVAVGNCAKFMSNFGMSHWLAALRILQFLIKYPKMEVVFEYTEDGEGLILMYECDSAYADCPDTRRSRYGFLGFLAGGVIVAKTAMFKSVMPSTGAAEQSALAKCTLHTLAARQYLEEFGFPQWDPTPIGEDNNSALLNSRNPVKSKTQKYLDVYHHITRENQMEFKTINVYRLPTNQMRADLMTKNLPRPLFWQHVMNSYNYEPKDYVLDNVHFEV